MRYFTLLFCFLLISFVSAQYSNLPQSPVSVGTGAIVGEQTGTSVAFVGDTNGDGFSEYVSGAIGVAPGHVYLFDGASGAILNTFTGAVQSFGFSVAGLGDLNGNGIPDFAVGSEPLAGGVYVYETNGNLLLTIAPPPQNTGFFGWDIANAGDLTGDGVNDILITSAVLGAGTTYIYNGATGVLINSLPQGYSVSGFVDLTADGIPEFIVGSPYSATLPFPPGGAFGRAFIYNGATFASLVTLVAGTGAINDLFGVDVVNAGDYNGDGVNDIIVGAPGLGGPQPTYPLFPGHAYVYSGSNFAQLTQFSGNLIGDYFGNSVSGGDFNKDGFGDVLVGVNTFPNYNYVGKVDIFLGPSGNNVYTWNGASQVNNFGLFLSVSDFNGDGFSDFVSDRTGPLTTPGSAVVHTLGGVWKYGGGPLNFAWTSTPGVAGTGSVTVSGGMPNAPLYLIWSTTSASIPISLNNVLYVNPNSPQFGVLYLGNLDAQGGTTLSGLNIIAPALAGTNVYFQVGTYSGGGLQNVQLSNGLQMIYLP